MQRRTLLRAMASVSGLGLTAAAGCALLPPLPYRRAPTAQDAALWLTLESDGTIRLLLPRAEMGQGVLATARALVAGEIGWPLERVVVDLPNTTRLPPTRATVGSDSIRDFAPLLIQAATDLRRQMANQGFRVGGPLPETGPIAGATAPDLVRDLVTGRATPFAGDVHLPGMVHATILPPPQLGLKPERVQDDDARRLPGVLGVVRLGHRLVLAAERRGQLDAARSRLHITWTGTPIPETAVADAVDIDRHLGMGPLDHTLRADPVSGPWDIDLRLDVPMAAHASLEPRTAVAQVHDGRAEVWTGSQDIGFVQAMVADALGLRSAQVRVQACRIGGGFGLKTVGTIERDAALAARALGRPVLLQPGRAEEFADAFHRPPSSHRIRARLGADGIAGWHHAVVSGPVIFTDAALTPLLRFATSFLADGGVSRGLELPYRSTAARMEARSVRLPVVTGPWRGLGAAPNGWAMETAIDALARHHRLDPLALRRTLLGQQQPRLLRVLEAAAAQADWQAYQATPTRALGLACGIYKAMTYVAVVAEVERTGASVHVTRLWAAQDCGRVFNPDQVRAQVEGCLAWCVGMALVENLSIANGSLSATSFADYPIPRLSDLPVMAVSLIDSTDQPGGAGEPAMVAGTAAITNAIARLTGDTVTRLPWRPTSRP